METWKRIEIDNEQWNYEVSNHGRIRNMKGQILKQIKTERGYLKVVLWKDGKEKNYKVHRLVANAFIPNPNNYETVNHINEDKSDNRVDNLEWLSLKNNIQHGTGISRRSEQRKKKVKCIETDKEYESIKQCAKEMCLNEGNISSCCKGKMKSYRNFHFEYID